MKTKFIILIFIAVWLSIIVRIFSLSIQSNSYYDKLSYSNSIKIEPIVPVRGEILDVNNKPLAINQLGFKIQLAPHLSFKNNQDKLELELDEIIKLLPELNKAKMLMEYKKVDSYYNHSFIDVVPFIPYEKIIPIYSMLSLRENVKIVMAPKRFYPYDSVASHILGYVAKASVEDVQEDSLQELIGFAGKGGLEKYYNSYLQGVAGEREIKVNANNKEIEELSYKKSDEDRALVLNIDIELQKYISSLFEGKAGAVVVMGVDGSVLAAGSFPEYNLNSFVSGISADDWSKMISSLDKPFTNKLINGLYPPGSTIKTGLGLLYITSNEVGANFGVTCTAELPMGGRIFRCWKKEGHYGTDITKAIRESCDDFFYKGSLRLGIDKISEGLLRYGLGRKTGIDLPNEFMGTVPSREWKRQKLNKPWYIGETLNTSIGQGNFLSTPLQITRFTALMATGKLPVPHVARYIGDKEIANEYEDVLSEDEKKKLPIIQKAMYEVCNVAGGTAKRYLNTKVQLAGKTGTAQVVGIKQNIKQRELEHEMSYYNRSHAWMSAYGPYKNPKYVVTTMVEHGGHGGVATGEIISKIYDKLVELGYITLDAETTQKE